MQGMSSVITVPGLMKRLSSLGVNFDDFLEGATLFGQQCYAVHYYHQAFCLAEFEQAIALHSSNSHLAGRACRIDFA